MSSKTKRSSAPRPGVAEYLGREEPPRSDPRQRPTLATTKGQIRYRKLIFLGDFIALLLAVTLSYLWVDEYRGGQDAPAVFGASLVTIPIWLGFAYGADLYHRFQHRISRNLSDDFGRLLVLTTAWIWLFTLARAAFSLDPTDLLLPIAIWLTALILVPVVRVLLRFTADRRGWTTQRVVLVGFEGANNGLIRRIGRHPEWFLEVVLVVDWDSESRPNGRREEESQSLVESLDPQTSLLDLPRTSVTLAGQEAIINSVVELIEAQDVSRVILASRINLPTVPENRLDVVDQLMLALGPGVSVDLVSGGPETLFAFSRAMTDDLEGVTLLCLSTGIRRRSSLVLKRMVDVVGSALGLLVLSPILAVTAVRIKLESRGPVFYRQSRSGYQGEVFELVKFRTMVENADELRDDMRETLDAEGGDVLFKIKEDPRITRVGKALRRTSIDELPQLWNVLTGEMSLVGPRPLPLEEAAQAESVFPARTKMRPGLAGPWQAFGRSEIPFEDMIKLDYSYVNGSSTLGDFKLLLKTLHAVIVRRGAM